MSLFLKFTRLLLFFSFFSLIVPCAFAQKRTKVSKKGITSSSRTTDPRITAPTLRKFNHSYEIETTYNKFEDFTNVLLSLGYGRDKYVHGYIFLTFNYKGSKITKSLQSITFQYNEYARTYKGNTSAMIVLADNDKLIMNSYNCDYTDGKVCLFDIQYKKFLLIANSSNVEMQVGDDQFELTEEELEAMKDFASRTVRSQ